MFTFVKLYSPSGQLIFYFILSRTIVKQSGEKQYTIDVNSQRRGNRRRKICEKLHAKDVKFLIKCSCYAMKILSLELFGPTTKLAINCGSSDFSFYL